MNQTNTSGFTLIEAIIYIALFSFIIGGSIISTYHIFDGQWKIQKIAREEAELNFVLRKLDWLSSGLAAGGVNSPDTDETTSMLRAYKGATVYTIELDDDIITLNGEPISELLQVSSLEFSRTGGTPNILSIELTVNGEDIGPITHYVRTD